MNSRLINSGNNLTTIPDFSVLVGSNLTYLSLYGNDLCGDFKTNGLSNTTIFSLYSIYVRSWIWTKKT
jgi:hypothetical protein